MNKIVVKEILKVGIVFISSILSLTGYVKDNYVVSQIKPKEVNQKVKIEHEEVKQEAEAPHVIQNEETNVEQVVMNEVEETPIAAAPVIEENRIQISNVLNSPLMKDEDGSNFYLSHNADGVYDGRGVPYIDFRTNFLTRKTIIYAHSTVGGNGPFQVLQNYHNNKGFYDANRYITIHYNGNVYTYEIFSVYVSLADNDYSEGLEYFRVMSYNDSEWEETIQKYKNNSEYDTGVAVSGNDNILILQTCSVDPNYYEHYYRYNLLVMGKLV